MAAEMGGSDGQAQEDAQAPVHAASPAEAEPSDDAGVPASPGEAALGVTEAPAPVAKLSSVGLLKFSGPEEHPVLMEEGLRAIESLPGPCCIIAYVGEGRSGKSYLASKIIGEGAFPDDDSDVAVTSGIDVCTIANHPGHLIVLDCEGGNNAMSKSHAIVTVVGALLATALVFVTDGKTSESSIEALARMLEERSIIKCDGTGSLHAQTLLFVVNQNRLRYDEQALEKILAKRHDAIGSELREIIGRAYPKDRRQFFTIPPDTKKGFEEKLEELHGAILEAARPLKMGKLWMTGKQVVQMLQQVEVELRKHGKVSLPSLHRHVILDSWLKPTISQVIASGMGSLINSAADEEWAMQKTGTVKGTCTECTTADVEGWLDPDVDDFFCRPCWVKFSPNVLKCAFCNAFQPWPLGRVEVTTKTWHCMDCLLQMGITVD